MLLKSQGPHSHILLTEGSEGIFGSEILAKRDFFGSVKDAGNFWVAKKSREIFWGFILFISSNQKYHKCNLLLVWDFLGGMLKTKGFG